MNTKRKRIISFGRGYKDYVMYTAFTLNNMGYKVLVNDRSDDRELAVIISHNDIGSTIRTYRNIDFNFSEDELEGYDYVITYLTEIDRNIKYSDYQYMIINSTLYKSDIFKSEAMIKLFNGDIIFILRDRIGSIGRKYIAKFMISSEQILCMYEVKLDEYDKEYQYGMDYDGIVDFKYISDSLCKILIKSISVISGRSQETVRKALKWAKGGKVFDNRFLE